jgi:tetratricopeptide (TPR) repeat protein
MATAPRLEPAPAEGAGPAARLIEQDVPLSSSILWTWMKQYYTDGGVAVWTGGDIPFHITNTPALAAEWVHTIFTLLRDFQRQGRIDPDHPIEVYELGPGTGRHAFFLLRELQKAEEESKILFPQGLRFELQLAELGSKGLQALADHPQLQPYLASGRLRLSQFDIGSDAQPRLWPEPDESRPPSKNPVFVVANYVLDSLPYDVVRYQGKKRALGLATVAVQGLAEGADPRSLSELGERIELRFSFPDQPVQFANPDWNRVLDRYAALEDTHLPFPSAAMEFLERLRSWSQQAAVLLVADKSFVDIDQLQCLEEPELVPHGGGFSFNANVHALGLLTEGWGGHAWHTSARDGTLDLSHLVVPALEFSEQPQPFLEMVRRMRHLEEFHAVDRFRLKESVDLAVSRPNLRLSLDLLRLSGQDPQVFYELSDHILHGLDYEEVDDESEAELRVQLGHCLDAVFPVGDDVDMAFEIGRVAYRLELYALSERAFRMSIEQFGDDPKAHFNLGLGWYYQNRWAEAEAAFQRALEIDERYLDAEEWLRKTRRHSGKSEPEDGGNELPA